MKIHLLKPESQRLLGIQSKSIHGEICNTSDIRCSQSFPFTQPTERRLNRQQIHLPKEPLSNQWFEDNTKWLEEHVKCDQKERELRADLQVLQENLQISQANVAEAYIVLENQRLEILAMKKANAVLADELEAEREKLAASEKRNEEFSVKAGVVTPPEAEAAQICLAVSSQTFETL